MGEVEKHSRFWKMRLKTFKIKKILNFNIFVQNFIYLTQDTKNKLARPT